MLTEEIRDIKNSHGWMLEEIWGDKHAGELGKALSDGRNAEKIVEELVRWEFPARKIKEILDAKSLDDDGMIDLIFKTQEKLQEGRRTATDPCSFTLVSCG